MNLMKKILFTLVLCLPLHALGTTYEVESIDEPYSYFIQPTISVGFKDTCRERVVLWPGTWGRMVFLTGETPEFLQKRIKTLHRGYLPIVETSEVRDGIRYSIQTFATTHSFQPGPEGKTIMFIKLSVRNVSNTQKEASFWAGVDYPAWRHTYQAVQVDPQQQYSMEDGWSLQGADALYYYDDDTVSRKYISLGMPYDGPKTLEEISAVPFGTPVCVTRFDWQLRPLEERSVSIKIPATRFVLKNNRPFAETIQKADYSQYFQRTIQFWEDILAKGTQYCIPEKKTSDVLKTALIYTLIARVDAEEGMEQWDSANSQYPEYWFRDCSVTHTRAYDLFNLSEYSRQNIEYMRNTVWFGPREIVKAHKIPSRYASKWGINPDPWDRSDLNKYGQKLWVYGEHYLLTRDEQFAGEILPEVNGLINWMDIVIKEDPDGLIPACSLYDNEWVVNAHRPGDDFWALAGLRAAKRMGEYSGNTDMARKADSVINRLQEALLKAVDKVMAEAGYVPGSFDRNRCAVRFAGVGQIHDGWGEDRDNALMVWPSGALPPDHPAVTASIDKWHSRWGEGITSFYNDKPGATFPYRGIWLMQQQMTRPHDQEQTVKDLYAQLVHTGSTNGSYEVAWKSRYGVEMHGWFWAMYIEFMRNVFVCEDWDDNLRIFSLIAPAWAKPGNTIGVKSALTHYGSVDLTGLMRSDGMDITIDAKFHHPPASIQMPLPYFADVSKVLIDGKDIAVAGSVVSMPADTHQVKIFWKTKPDKIQLNYADYLSEFWKSLKPVRLPVRKIYSAQERRNLWSKTDWGILGPFNSTQSSGFDTVYPPEKEIDLKAVYQGQNGKTIQWKNTTVMSAELIARDKMPVDYRGWKWPQTNHDYWGVDFNLSFRSQVNTDVVAYGYSNIWSPEQQTVKLYLASDGNPIKIWIDSTEVFASENPVKHSQPYVAPDAQTIDIELQRGWNPVLVKVCHVGMPKWGFGISIIDMNDKPISEIYLSPDKKKSNQGVLAL